MAWVKWSLSFFSALLPERQPEFDWCLWNNSVLQVFVGQNRTDLWVSRKTLVCDSSEWDFHTFTDAEIGQSIRSSNPPPCHCKFVHYISASKHSVICLSFDSRWNLAVFTIFLQQNHNIVLHWQYRFHQQIIATKLRWSHMICIV